MPLQWRRSCARSSRLCRPRIAPVRPTIANGPTRRDAFRFPAAWNAAVRRATAKRTRNTVLPQDPARHGRQGTADTPPASPGRRGSRCRTADPSTCPGCGYSGRRSSSSGPIGEAPAVAGSASTWRASPARSPADAAGRTERGTHHRAPRRWTACRSRRPWRDAARRLSEPSGDGCRQTAAGRSMPKAWRAACLRRRGSDKARRQPSSRCDAARRIQASPGPSAAGSFA